MFRILINIPFAICSRCCLQSGSALWQTNLGSYFQVLLPERCFLPDCRWRHCTGSGWLGSAQFDWERTSHCSLWPYTGEIASTSIVKLFRELYYVMLLIHEFQTGSLTPIYSAFQMKESSTKLSTEHSECPHPTGMLKSEIQPCSMQERLWYTS